MFPNEKFQEYFPDAEIPEELPEEYRSCSLRIGSYAVISKVLKEYSLPGMLAKWFSEDAGLLLDCFLQVLFAPPFLYFNYTVNTGYLGWVIFKYKSRYLHCELTHF